MYCTRYSERKETFDNLYSQGDKNVAGQSVLCPRNHKQCRKPSTSLLCSSSFSALVVAAGTFKGCLPRSTLHCFSMAGFSLYEGSLKAHKIPLKPRNISPVEVYCPQDVSYVRLVLIGLPLLNMLSHALPSL